MARSTHKNCFRIESLESRQLFSADLAIIPAAGGLNMNTVPVIAGGIKGDGPLRAAMLARVAQPAAAKAGDMNGDGVVNNFDIGPFQLAVTQPDAFKAAYPSADRVRKCDINGDGKVDNLDVQVFERLLTGINPLVTGKAPVGDMNGDGVVNNADTADFELALTDPVAYQAKYPKADCIHSGDVNGDGMFNNFDVQPFQALLPPAPTPPGGTIDRILIQPFQNLLPGATTTPAGKVLVGDMNGDGVVNSADVPDFELALTDPQAYKAQHPDRVDAAIVGDINGDGVLDNFDIQAFQHLVANGST